MIYDRIMNICKYLCHQKPERSFFYKEKQFPVCSRCTGIVIGAAAGFVLASLTQPNLIFVLGFIPLIIDGTTQYYGLRTSNNTLRFVTGLLCGFSIPFVVFKTESGENEQVNTKFHLGNKHQAFHIAPKGSFVMYRQPHDNELGCFCFEFQVLCRYVNHITGNVSYLILDPSEINIL